MGWDSHTCWLWEDRSVTETRGDPAWYWAWWASVERQTRFACPRSSAVPIHSSPQFAPRYHLRAVQLLETPSSMSPMPSLTLLTLNPSPSNPQILTKPDTARFLLQDVWMRDCSGIPLPRPWRRRGAKVRAKERQAKEPRQDFHALCFSRQSRTRHTREMRASRWRGLASHVAERPDSIKPTWKVRQSSIYWYIYLWFIIFLFKCILP